MKRAMCAALLAVGLGTSVSDASAAFIDFSLTPSGNLASYTEQGVTFTASGGGQITASAYGNTPNGTRGLAGVLANSIFPELRADIAGGATWVSVDLGDFGFEVDGESDLLFLEIFDAANVSLGFTSELIDGSFSGMRTLSLSSASNIAFAIFGARSPALLGSSVYADNFRTSVPEPGTLALLGLGLAALAAARRHKQ